jgi:16S rRNA (adenine1518-N6/adenine1519-N6)-dimethyltransferase
MNDFQQTTLANINIVRNIANTLGGGLNKSLGQNFLINQQTLLRFVDSLKIAKDDCIIEIGPGIGVVSYTLCERAKKVYLIEIDKTKQEALNKVLENYSNYEIIWGDATDFNFADLRKKLELEGFKSENIKLIGSLPYNVGKRIIYNLLVSDFDWTIASFFLQKEVAENYTSKIPNAEFLSIYAKIFADVNFLFSVPPEHFMPIPKVKTGVVQFIKHNKFDHLDKAAFSKFIKQGFTQPRKTVLNNLKSLGFKAESFEQANIKVTARPSELELPQWEKLFSMLLSPLDEKVTKES